jgi:hypothetical protein
MRGVRATAAAPSTACSSGAHSLSPFAAHVYPETGNGGYTSVHTDVFLTYDTQSNLFLPGTHVVLTNQATQCLTDFSLDFERTSPNRKDGPDLTIGSVLVNGVPAAFTFVQPTYPGDPNGQNDPDPRAHEAGQLNPVGGPDNNPFPPACTPELMSTNPNKQFDLDGTQCPANKLVITPTSPIASGAQFEVRVFYTGRPGVHNDGDGTTEGWFRVDQPGDAGSFVTTEPVASEAWMPLNNHPSSKPTYDIYDTVPARQDGDRQRRARLAAGEPSGCELPRRLDDLALALAGGHRVVPRGEQHRLIRPHGAPLAEWDPVLRGARPGDPEEPGRRQQGDHGPAGRRPQLPDPFNGPVPVHDGRAS